MPLISIIMPVYNAGEYLNAAIESILKQTLEDYELIIIDDGSTDGSYQIAKKYADSDSRIRLYCQKNSGICAARNYALSLVTGKYTVFCDHDDEYVDLFLEHAVSKMEKCSADAVIFGYRYHKCFSGKKSIITIQSYADRIFFENDIKENYFILRSYWYRVWGAIYSTQLIRSKELSFDTSVKFGGEDIAFNANFLEVAKKIVCVENVGYIHYQREETSTSAKFDNNRLVTIEKQLESDLLFCDRAFETTSEQKKQFLLLCAVQLWTYLEKLNYFSCPYSKKEKRLLVKKFVEKFVQPKMNPKVIFFDAFKYSKKYGILLFFCFLKAYSILLFLVKFKRG